jgi:Uncharacterised nucleotidyltransferase
VTRPSSNGLPATAGRHSWLLADGPVPHEEPPSRDELQAAYAFALSNWQVLPVVYPRLRAWLGDRYADDPLVEGLRDVYVGVQVLTGMQTRLCLRFVGELARSGIPYSLLKGSALRFSAYASPEQRGGLDVDVGVPFEFLADAEDVARSQGFLPAMLDAERRHFLQVDEEDRRAVEANHYELACLVRHQVIHDLPAEVEEAVRRSVDILAAWHVTPEDELGCYVTLDVHHGLCLDISVDPVVDSAQALESADFGTVYVPTPAWAAFHLIYKIYWEGVHNYRKGVYQYADLVRLAPQIRGDETDLLVALFERWALEAAGFYVLRRLESDFGLPLDGPLRSFVGRAALPPRGHFPSEVNDMGDMWPKIWGYR